MKSLRFAYGCGEPVIRFKLGAMEEIVDDGRTGLHFEQSSAEDLVRKVEWAWSHPDEMVTMGREARKAYEAKYAADTN